MYVLIYVVRIGIDSLTPTDKLHAFVDGLHLTFCWDVQKYDPPTLHGASQYVERINDLGGGSPSWQDWPSSSHGGSDNNKYLNGNSSQSLIIGGTMSLFNCPNKAIALKNSNNLFKLLGKTALAILQPMGQITLCETLLWPGTRSRGPWL